MAVSLNSVTSFNPATNYYQHSRKDNAAAPFLSKIPSVASISVGIRHYTGGRRSRLHLPATGDNVFVKTSDNNSKSLSTSHSDDDSSNNVSDDTIQSSADPRQESSAAKSSSPTKRASLTARERLRAARVLNRYTDSKPSKPELGSRLLDALQESDKGKKRSGLPEAPTNLLDDSRRGMPKEGWTIELPGGMDVFFIVVSFVLISSVMFATTFVVWKVGAIHFNEY